MNIEPNIQNKELFQLNQKSPGEIIDIEKINSENNSTSEPVIEYSNNLNNTNNF